MLKPRRKKPANLKGKTLALLRKLGYVAADVEKFNSFTKRRHDLFGFADILAFDPNGGNTGVFTMDACRVKDIADHVKKAQAAPLLPLWYASSHRHHYLCAWTKPAHRWQYQFVLIGRKDATQVTQIP